MPVNRRRFRIEQAFVGDMPMPENAWALIFDPKYAAKLKGCGVNFLDSASEVLPVAMHSGQPATAGGGSRTWT